MEEIEVIDLSKCKAITDEQWKRIKEAVSDLRDERDYWRMKYEALSKQQNQNQ